MESKTYGSGLRFEAYLTEGCLLPDGQPMKAGQVLMKSPIFWESSDDEQLQKVTADFEYTVGALVARGLPVTYRVALMLRERGEGAKAKT